MLETLFLGVVLAVLYVEFIGIYPGGIIVPAYFALFLDQPLRALATILIALASLALYKILARYFILFGKRRFVLIILLGGTLNEIWMLLAPQVMALPLELRAIGWVIPGLLANNLERQKPLPTLASLITVSVMTYFLAKLW